MKNLNQKNFSIIFPASVSPSNEKYNFAQPEGQMLTLKGKKVTLKAWFPG